MIGGLVKKADLKRNPVLCSAGTTGMVPDEGRVRSFCRTDTEVTAMIESGPSCSPSVS